MDQILKSGVNEEDFYGEDDVMRDGIDYGLPILRTPVERELRTPYNRYTLEYLDAKAGYKFHPVLIKGLLFIAEEPSNGRGTSGTSSERAISVAGSRRSSKSRRSKSRKSSRSTRTKTPTFHPALAYNKDDYDKDWPFDIFATCDTDNPQPIFLNELCKKTDLKCRVQILRGQSLTAQTNKA